MPPGWITGVDGGYLEGLLVPGSRGVVLAEVMDVMAEDVRVTRARLRSELREIDGRIARIRAEDRMFRRYGFGSDLHELQIVALQAQRQELLTHLARLDRASRQRSGSVGLGGWLLLPPALIALAVRSLFDRRGRIPPPVRSIGLS
ncbi:MAG: hypothetical protein IRY83_10545 [Chloroflexi bacterium]|nr:hypothetical protein [Chloroflexota bacterium]